MKFRTKYSDKNGRSSKVGDPVKVEYQLVVNDDGTKELKPCGQTNVKEYIQSFRDSVDIDKILARYANGAEDVLNQVKGFYADVTDLPVKLSDVMNLNMRGQEFFDGLKPELKALYDNDYMQFMADPSKLMDFLNEKENLSNHVEPAKDEKKVNDDYEEQ